MEILRVESLTKDFGGVRALMEVSFSVRPGERLAIIGPNGAGKSTLFNLLSGQLSPTGGRIFLFGEEINPLPAHRRIHLGLAQSFQIPSLFSPFPVIENVLLSLLGTNRSRFQMVRSVRAYRDLYARARDLLVSWDLLEKRDELVQNLSYGEQRRLEIILGLASNPKLLLLDEPSSGLTSEENAGIIRMIHDLGAETTVIMVAHDMDLVFGVAERIIVLHHGEIMAQGTPEQIKANPKVTGIYMGIEEGPEDAGTL